MQKIVTWLRGQEGQDGNDGPDKLLGAPERRSSQSVHAEEGRGPTLATSVETGAATGGPTSEAPYSVALPHSSQQAPVRPQLSPPQPARTVRPAANYVEFAQMHQTRPNQAGHQAPITPLPMRPPSFRGMVPDGEDIDADRTLGGRVRGGDKPLTTDELRALFRQEGGSFGISASARADGPESRRESKRAQLSTMRAQLSAVRQVSRKDSTGMPSRTGDTAGALRSTKLPLVNRSSHVLCVMVAGFAHSRRWQQGR